MNLKSLRVFVNVMDEGTLAQACRKMNLSQPAASRLVQILEAEYDIQLFHRDRKRMVPTHQAEAFYPQAVRILASVDDLPHMFQQIATNSTPPLRVICHPRMVDGLIGPAMARMARLDPKIKLKLEVHPRRYLGRRIMHGLYDVGVATLPLPDQNPSAQLLTQADLQIALPEGHPKAHKQVLTPEDVRDLSYVALEESTNMRALLDRQLTKADEHLDVTHEMSTSTAACRLVREGIGYTFTDPITLSPDEQHGLAVRAWRPHVNIDFGYFVSATKLPHPARSRFVDILKEICDSRLSIDSKRRN